jgi:hypothetical protein
MPTHANLAAWEGGAQRASRFERALARALELFDLTARDDRWRGHRRREILRAREEFCRLFFGDQAPSGAARTLNGYFFHFQGVRCGNRLLALVSNERFVTAIGTVAIAAATASTSSDPDRSSGARTAFPRT